MERLSGSRGRAEDGLAYTEATLKRFLQSVQRGGIGALVSWPAMQATRARCDAGTVL